MDNTEVFIRQINTNDISTVVTKFFDEIMVLYNLIGIRNNMSISVDGNTAAALFTLSMNNNDDATALFNVLNNTYFRIYSDTFSIHMELHETEIMTEIRKINV